MTKVSIIVPIYNMELYLKECLDSILSQTLKEIEVVCIDDGSTDRSWEILAEYAKAPFVRAVGGSWLFGDVLGGGLIGIWIAMACDECLRGALFTIRFRRGKWKEKRLVSDSTKGT